MDRFKNKVLTTHRSIDLALSLVELFAQEAPSDCADLVHNPITGRCVRVVCVNVIYAASSTIAQKLKRVAVGLRLQLCIVLVTISRVGYCRFDGFFKRGDVSEIDKFVELVYVLIVLVKSCTYSCDVSVAMTVDGSDAGVAVDNCDEAAG